MPMTNRLDETIGKNFNRLVELAHKFNKSMIKSNSKVHKPLTYNEIVNN